MKIIKKIVKFLLKGLWCSKLSFDIWKKKKTYDQLRWFQIEIQHVAWEIQEKTVLVINMPFLSYALYGSHFLTADKKGDFSLFFLNI